MKKNIIFLIIFLILLKSEEIITCECIYKSKNVKLEVNNDYIEIPKSKPIDFSKYQNHEEIQEKKKDRKPILFQDISMLPLAETFPIEESNNSISKRVATIIGLELKD